MDAQERLMRPQRVGSELRGTRLNVGELRQHKLRRITLPRTPVNKGKRKQTCSLCVRPMGGVTVTENEAVAANHESTNRVGWAGHRPTSDRPLKPPTAMRRSVKESVCKRKGRDPRS